MKLQFIYKENYLIKSLNLPAKKQKSATTGADFC